MLASFLSYAEGRKLKHPIKESALIPDYLGKRVTVSGASISLEEQQKEFSAFAAKLKSMAGVS
jgi:hypothetical protein